LPYPPLGFHEPVPRQNIVAGRVTDRIPGFESQALVDYRSKLVWTEPRRVPDLHDPPLDVRRSLVLWRGVRSSRSEPQALDPFFPEPLHQALQLPLRPAYHLCGPLPRDTERCQGTRYGVIALLHVLWLCPY